MGMTLVELPAQILSEVIRWIDDPRDELHDHITRVVPVLDDKMLDIDVAGVLGWNVSIDHVDSRLVVATQGGRSLRWETKLFHDSTQVPGVLGSGDSCQEFGLSRTGGCDRLHFTVVGNSTTTQQKYIASCRMTVTQVVGMCGIGEASQLEHIHDRERWKLARMCHACEVGRG